MNIPPKALTAIQAKTLASHYFAADLDGHSMHVIAGYCGEGWRNVHVYPDGSTFYTLPEDTLAKALQVFEDELHRINANRN